MRGTVLRSKVGTEHPPICRRHLERVGRSVNAVITGPAMYSFLALTGRCTVTAVMALHFGVTAMRAGQFYKMLFIQ